MRSLDKMDLYMDLMGKMWEDFAQTLAFQQLVA